LDENHTVLEQVFADSGEQMALVREYEELSDKLAHAQDDSSQLMSRLTVMQRMEVSGAWGWRRMQNYPHQLGIQDFDASIGSLSGYRKRIALATAYSRSRMCC